nr:heterokaryon incompatibility protein 6, or allele [Quercus suber]
MLGRARSYSWPETRYGTRTPGQVARLEETWMLGRSAAGSLYARLSLIEIRLLVLYPGVDNEPLRANLSAVPLFNAVPYRALSYCWGSSNRTKRIIINQRSIDITESLFAALRKLRQNTYFTVLWADAICINQDDEDEKRRQLKKVASIYRQAANVEVYLDGHRPGYALTSWMLYWLYGYGFDHKIEPMLYQFRPRALLQAFHQSLIDANDDFRCLCCGVPFRWKTESDSGRLQEGLQAMNDLLNLAWFQRLWTLQENAVAQLSIFRLGQHRMNWELLAGAIKICEQYAYCESPFSVKERDVFAKAVRIGNVVAQYHESVKANGSARGTQCLLSIMIGTWHLKSSFAKDRFNSIKALAFVEHDDDLQFSVNFDEWALWSRVACFLLTRKTAWNNKDIYGPCVCRSFVLTLAGLQPSGRDPLLPSWAPDMARLNRQSEKKYHYALANQPFNRAGGLGKTFSVDVETVPGTLFVHGVHISEIVETLPGSQYRPSKDTWVTDIIRAGWDDDRPVSSSNHDQFAPYPDDDPEDAWGWQLYFELREWLIPWYLLCHEFAHDRPNKFTNGEYKATDFSTLITQGCIDNLPMFREIFHRNERQEAMLSIVSKMFKRLPQDCSSSARSKPTPEQFCEDMHIWLHPRLRAEGRCFDDARILAYFSDGRIGWVPEHAQNGDALYLLKGAPEPYILRRDRGGLYSPTGAPLYTLVGDAYVLGIMWGEAWPSGVKMTNDDVIGMI